MKTNVKKIAKAAILAAAISGGTLMFVTPFEAKLIVEVEIRVEFAIMQVQM